MGQTGTIGKTATRVYQENGDTCVRYHDTVVVRFNDDKIVLNTGGWKTVTTKARMNQTSNQYDLGFQVSQSNFEWYVDGKPFNGDSFEIDRKPSKVSGTILSKS